MLTTKTFAAVTTQDPTLTKVQSNLSTVLNPVLQTSLLDGVLLQNQTITTGGKLVASHGLGRAAQGVIVVMANATVSTPYAIANEQTTPTGAIRLTFDTGAGATVSLWVF